MDSLKRHTDYGQKSLHEAHLQANPIESFADWLRDAEEQGIYEPNAFVLGTASVNGLPNARTVLLKGIIDGDFFFASNYGSQKAIELKDNPMASMVFGWYGMHRQVIVQGSVRKASRKDSVAYFESRPHESQVASWLSSQSQPIESREVLEQRFSSALENFADTAVPTPEHWGGYLITPFRIEFWQGRTSRMHDRIEFARPSQSADWQIRRLQP